MGEQKITDWDDAGHAESTQKEQGAINAENEKQVSGKQVSRKWKLATVILACMLTVSAGVHIWSFTRFQPMQDGSAGQNDSELQSMQMQGDLQEAEGQQMQDIQEEQSGQAALLESIYLENGDHVSILPVVDTGGKNLSGPPIEKEMNLLVYLSDSCGGCLGSMGTLRDLMGVFGTDEIGYAYLYSNSVPRNVEEKYGISREYCYCLDENLMLATSLPTFYLVDGKGTVVFRTDKLELIIQKLIAMEIVPQEKLIEQADAYLLERYFQAESDKQQIIYFAMKGCGDCEAADELIDSEEVGERYDVVRIYRDKTEEEGEAGDDFGLFREVYGISWYPSFEILRGSEREFVGEVSLGELERILMR